MDINNNMMMKIMIYNCQTIVKTRIDHQLEIAIMVMVMTMVMAIVMVMGLIKLGCQVIW
jgi:hypothetical protein